MRVLMGLLGLFLGLWAVDGNAQIVYRDKVTTTQLTEGADVVVLGEVGLVETVGSEEHQGFLIPVKTVRVLKGPEAPGPIQVFTFAGTSGTVPFEEGERPLLFLNVLHKEDLICAHCGKRGLDIVELPDGNYYLVRGGKWGRLLPGDLHADQVAETIRLKGEEDFAGLKDHWMGLTEGPDGRVALDGVIDLLAEERARKVLDLSDSAALVALLRSPGERFRPIDPLVLLAAHTGLPEALPPILDLARADSGPGTSIISTSLTLLAGSGVEVVSSIRGELESPEVAFGAKDRLIRIAAEMKERGLTDAVIVLAGDGELRKTALLALGDLEDPKGLPILRGALQEGEMGDRKAAAVALAYFGPDGVETIKDYQAAHPDDELTRFIDELRRNPAQVRGLLRR